MTTTSIQADNSPSEDRRSDPHSKQMPLAIKAYGVGKSFHVFDGSLARLKHYLGGRNREETPVFHALRNIHFEVEAGEVVGIIGRNGAGKSTLLHLVCGTLQPSNGVLQVNGRIAALLELGAGFNPEYSGVENIFLNAAILGLKKADIEQRLPDILAFADIGAFIHQPVKTYSSGMFMRLAFAVATSVDPDVLVIDEALSVGDGAFARKSFERIMQLKKAGKTILFCSHSLYQVEALCSRAIWLDRGEIRLQGEAMDVTKAYSNFLNASDDRREAEPVVGTMQAQVASTAGEGRIVNVAGMVKGGDEGRTLRLQSRRSDLCITIEFVMDPALPPATVAVAIEDTRGVIITSAGAIHDQVVLERGPDGYGKIQIVFPNIPLLKGQYQVSCYLASQDGLMLYDQAASCITLDVSQRGLEQGIVWLSHEWLQ